ncbi:hypothetical protein [Streptomyces sp. NEAU-NA10]|uniref:hypothetical protein n=1 Tax=Streptomyces sp. NEAU-NA10 TaxID=3416050 RepID=UPI003CC55A35
MTEVLVEQGELDDGVVMVFRDFGHRVRMLFDPARIAISSALDLLCRYLPRLIGAMKVVHHRAES